MKKQKKKKRKGRFLIFLGMLLFCGALGLIIYNLWDSIRAKKASDEIVAALDDEMKDEEPKAAPKYSGYSKTDDGSDENKEIPGMPVSYVNGYPYIGELEIPSVNMKLPVMEYWDYERLRISPCRYSGSYYTDDLVICAHNYATHFLPLQWIGLGTDVYFITVDKVVYHYIIDNRETVQPTSIAQMIENMNNSLDAMADWDLTLFTCNPDGLSRCTVRCRRVTEEVS